MSKGIRILDKNNHVVSVELKDILSLIEDGAQFQWSILFLFAIGNLGEGCSILDLEDEINESKDGKIVSWPELISLANKFDEVEEIRLIASKQKKDLVRYADDLDMYLTCDIVIEMINLAFWEVFSKDESLIKKFASKFNDVKFLEPDFQK